MAAHLKKATTVTAQRRVAPGCNPPTAHRDRDTTPLR